MKRLIKLILLLVLVLLLPVFLAGCSAEYVFPGSASEFFAGYTWDALLNMIVGALFGAFPTFNLFQIIKNKWGLSGPQAHWAVMAFSVVLAALLMGLTGALNFDVFELTFANVFQLGAYIYAGAQVAYQKFKNNGTN